MRVINKLNLTKFVRTLKNTKLMKTKLLITALLFAGVNVNTQITINSSNFFSAGDVIIEATSSVNMPNAAPGTNVTWNYAALDSSWGMDTLNYVVPSTTPFGSSFPTSNVAYFDLCDSFTDFYKKSTSFLELVGIYNGEGNPIKLSNSMVFFKFPFTYNTTFSDQYSFSYTESGASASSTADSVRYTFTGEKRWTVDSWGSLILPTGTFNALRLKDTLFETELEEELNSGTWTIVNTNIDTIYQNIFVSNNANIKDVLLTQDLDNTGAVIGDNWSIIIPFVAGINENSINIDLSIFPNPTINTLNIKSKTTFNKYIITDVLGKIVKQEEGSNIIKVNVENIDKGQYFITLYSNEGVITKTFSKK